MQFDSVDHTLVRHLYFFLQKCQLEVKAHEWLLEVSVQVQLCVNLPSLTCKFGTGPEALVTLVNACQWFIHAQ